MRIMSKWESYQVANRLKLANHWLQVILILCLLMCLNYLALQVFYRFDLTENHRYALSPETKAYLNDLTEPIKIFVTIPISSPQEEEQILYPMSDMRTQSDEVLDEMKGLHA